MNIKELRTQSGMTQQQFATFLNISIDTIQNWEQNRRKCPAYVLELIKYKLDKERIL